MAFPTTPLPLVTELLIDGAWAIVSDAMTVFDRRIADGLTITRGRKDWSTRVTASQCSQVFANSDGKYDNRNPNSPYYGLLGRNTQLRHRIRWVSDTFTRSASSSWGTSDSGQAWTNTGGSASDFSVGGSGQGKHTMTSVNVMRISTVTLPAGAPDVTTKVNSSAVATGASITSRLILGTDTSNYYEAQLILKTDSTVQLALTKRVAGADTTLASAVTMGTYSAGVRWSMRLGRTEHGTVRARAWKTDSEGEPTAWNLTATDTSVATSTIAGVQSRLETGNTNVNPVLSYDDFETSEYLFWGGVSSFIPTWDLSGSVVGMSVEASGVLQRLSGASTAQSPVYRSVSGVAAGDFVPWAYWSMEDSSGATQFASTADDVPAATVDGTVAFSSDDTLMGSQSLPVLAADSNVVAKIPTHTDFGFWSVQFLAKLAASPSADTVLLKVSTTSPTAATWKILIEAGSPDNLALRVYSASGIQLSADTRSLNTLFGSEADFYGQWFWFVLSGEQSGGNLNAYLDVYGVDGLIGGPFFGPVAGSIGTLTEWRIPPSAGITDAAVGHVAVFAGTNFGLGSTGVAVESLTGYAGELAGVRLARLCREAAVAFDLIGDSEDTAAMGPQQFAPLDDLLFDCVGADQGRLYESVDALGFTYRTRFSLYNQTPTELDYASHHIGGRFQPTADDQLLVNDVTVTRIDGSSARVRVTDGTLGTDTAGIYELRSELNLNTDDQTAPVAGWLAHLGTWDTDRYAEVTVLMAAPDVVADGLIGPVSRLDIGDTISVVNPPSWLAPEPVGLMIEGVTEYIGDGFDWTLTFNTVPSGPYDVVEVDSATLSRIEGDHVLASAVTSTATAWSVDTASGEGLVYDDAEDGMQWLVEGELVTVTDIASPSGGHQACIVTRSVNGIVKAHDAGAAIVLYPAPHLAL